MTKPQTLFGNGVQLTLPIYSEPIHHGEAALARGKQRAIESAFPFLEISKLARIESYRKNIYRPLYYLHKWWARRTGSVFRAILLASLLPEGALPMDFFYHANAFPNKVILDPFMGGGTTIGEALRLGVKTIGLDVNPVAWFLVKKVVEPVSLRALESAYRRLESTVASTVRDLYATACPDCASAAEAIYIYWVKLIPCQKCGQSVPLRKSMLLARHMSKPNYGLVTCPACGHPYLSSRLDKAQHCPACRFEFDHRKGFSRGARYTCQACGDTAQIVDSLRRQSEPPEHRMVAIYYRCPNCGKGYKQPDDGDRDKLEEIRLQIDRQRAGLRYPRLAIPQGYNTNQMLNYNYRFWFQMFNPRQLLGASLLLEAILQLENPNVVEFMLLLFSGALEFNNLFCSAKGLGTGAVRHLFAHHAYIPPKEPLEAHLWGVDRSSGGFSTLYRSRLRRGKAFAHRPIERRFTSEGVTKVPIPGERIETRLAADFRELVLADRHAMLLNKSSTDLSEVPDGAVDVVVTDPPYLDNVMYSELADFFYVWLRLGLAECYDQFEPVSSRQEDEAIKNLVHGKDEDFYRAMLQKVFCECHRVLKDGGLLVFTFHHSRSEAWDALGQALRGAGFAIVRVWPVHAEMDVGVPMQGKQSLRFDAILVCRKREEIAEFEVIGERDRIVQQLRNAVEPLCRTLTAAFTLSDAERASLYQAMAVQFYTQGRIAELPSSLSLSLEEMSET